MYYTLLRLFTVYYMLPLPEKGFYCISKSNHGPAVRLFHRHAGGFLFIYLFVCSLKTASDANTLRVIWIGDHMSIDDTY